MVFMFLFSQHDIHTALFLLPHVIMYALLDGNQEDLSEVSTDEVPLVVQTAKHFVSSFVLLP